MVPVLKKELQKLGEKRMKNKDISGKSMDIFEKNLPI